ncbi:MAG: LysR family transcriptional regulator, partial [Clostridium sp.]|nr:LysR family transcriptional regulator [Clostridium sp.]
THKLTNAENLVFIPLIGEEEVVEIIAAWKRSSGNLALQQFLGHYPLLKSE